jgi:signal transduction histidine kinase
MEELQELTPLDIKPEFSTDTFNELVGLLRKDREQLVKFTTVHERKDGSLYPVEVHMQLSRLEGRAVIVAIILDISERKLAEKQLQQYQQRLRALASELTMTEERERRRIATVLHDGAAQSLAFARMQLTSTCKAVAEADTTKKLEDVSQILRQSVEQIREVLLDLSSPSMNEIGLGVAISDWLAEQTGRRHGLRTSFADECGKLPLDDDVRAVLFRNTRELLANVVKHARADSVSIRMESTGEVLRITIEDDGAGFEPDKKLTTTDGGGFGLFSIRERMLDLGGSLEIVSAPGEGCKATLVVPLNNGEEGS